MNRAIRTNNPGALNISGWQRKRAGYVGQSAADGVGNITTIYQTPEHGVAAWFFLLSDRCGFGASRHFDSYRWQRNMPVHMQAMRRSKPTPMDGRNGPMGVLRPNTEIHLASDDEMLVFAKAEFAYEAAAPSPVDGKQILYGFSIERNAIAPVTS
ncbi:MAG: hypothetical protein ACRD36_01310 [Candidatus Acidiferrum sp.]